MFYCFSTWETFQGHSPASGALPQGAQEWDGTLSLQQETVPAIRCGVLITLTFPPHVLLSWRLPGSSPHLGCGAHRPKARCTGSFVSTDLRSSGILCCPGRSCSYLQGNSRHGIIQRVETENWPVMYKVVLVSTPNEA